MISEVLERGGSCITKKFTVPFEIIKMITPIKTAVDFDQYSF